MKLMKDILNFLIELGELKKMPRRGWVLRGIKNPETIAAHTFRMTMMSWVLCYKKKLNLDKVLKMCLIHDICEVHAGDATPYDNIFSEDKKQWEKTLDKWPRFSKKQKERFFLKKYKKEHSGLKKLIVNLPSDIKREIYCLWDDYEKGLTPEGKFVRQLDRMENLLQALEYWKGKKKFAIGPWWVQIEELIDEPVLLEFLAALDKKFHSKFKNEKN